MSSTGLTSWVIISDRPALLAPAGVDQVAHRPLLVEVERDQRLVAQQQPGVADQRLADPQPLLLAAGQAADPGVGERLGRCTVASMASTSRAPAARLAAAGRSGGRRCPGPGSRGPAAGCRGRRGAAAGRSRRAGGRGGRARRGSRSRPRSAAACRGSRAAGWSCPSRWGRGRRRTAPARTSRSSPDHSSPVAEAERGVPDRQHGRAARSRVGGRRAGRAPMRPAHSSPRAPSRTASRLPCIQPR